MTQQGFFFQARNKFQGCSIKGKLAIIVVITSSVAMLLTTTCFVAYELFSFRAAMVSEMSSVAEILGAASRAPLSFKDRHVAEENLSALRRDKRIVEAYIYDSDGNFFSRYQRAGNSSEPVIAKAHDRGEYFDASALLVYRPIFLDGENIGTITLRVSLSELYARIWKYMAIVGLVMAISLAFAFFLAIPLQRAISEPVHLLAETARRFSSGVSPGLRAVKLACNSHDEIGLLIDSFNEMLEKVESSSKALKSHGEFLEETVTSRTAELTAVNHELYEELQARRTAEDALRKSEERYALAVVGANNGLWDWDLTTDQIYFSPRWKSILGCSGDEIGEQPSDWIRRIHPLDSDRVRSELEAHCFGESREFESEYRILHNDGAYRWVLSRGLAVRGTDNQATRIAGSQTDITQSKVSDPLTGLPNRILFTERLLQAIDDSQRDPSRLFAVLFIDLDRFKVINDSLGHLAGDQLLIGIAQRLKNSACANDADLWSPETYTAARLGGDEFAVLLENVHTPEQASAVADTILNSLRPPFVLENREVFSDASIGIAVGSKGYKLPEEILRDADTAMYTAKTKGKAQWAIFDQRMGERANAKLELERDLRQAVAQHELYLDYQPIVHLKTGKLTGFEALLRWRHPLRGVVPPLEFIPIAEETGLINSIGRWALAEACMQMASWNLQFGREPMTISVNLSGKQLVKNVLTQEVADVLHHSGLDPVCLHLELTESILMQDTKTVIEIFTSLKSMAVGLSIDDFGTGYSSLSYLHCLPITTLKIDKSFVKTMGNGKEGLAIVNTIINLAGNLGMEVIAEGIETLGQKAQLQGLLCTHGQGYYIARPLSSAAAQSFIEAYRASAAPKSLPWQNVLNVNSADLVLSNA